MNFFYGLQEALRLLEEEGLANVFARHTRLGEAVRRCVKVWAGNNGPQLFCTNPARYSNSVTAVVMPEGHDADEMRNTARQRFNVSLGGGLGKLKGSVFRIGHLGRPERADGAGHAGQRGDGAAPQRRAARQGRRRGGDGFSGELRGRGTIKSHLLPLPLAGGGGGRGRSGTQATQQRAAATPPPNPLPQGEGKFSSASPT